MLLEGRGLEVRQKLSRNRIVDRFGRDAILRAPMDELAEAPLQ
jgi:hypothetical protein